LAVQGPPDTIRIERRDSMTAQAMTFRLKPVETLGRRDAGPLGGQ
jgi:hypothetical protein